MAIDPTTAVEQKQQLDLLSAQQVPTGLTEPLTGPAVPDQSFEVAGWATPIGEALGRLLGGSDLEKARQGLGDARQRRLDDPTAAQPGPLPDEVQPTAAPEVGVPTTAPRVEPEPIPTLSPEALGKRVRTQANPIRPSEMEADEFLKATLEPKLTERVSDGLTDFSTVGAGGDVKIPNEGKVYETIQQTSDTYKLNVDEATRGKIRHEVSQELADYLRISPKKLMAAVMNMRDTGGVPIVEGAGISETILAVRNLLYTEVSKLDALAEVAKEGDRADLLNFRQQLEVVSNLQTNFKGIQTEIGRSLGIFRIPVGHAHPAYRDINLSNMVQEFGGMGDIQKLAEAYLKLPTGSQRVNFTRVSKFKKFSNAVFEVWINNLLLGPITHTKNFVAAGLTVFGEIPVAFTAAAMGSVRRGLGGEGGVTFSQARATMFGQMMSVREALSAAGSSYRTGATPIAGSKLGDLSTAEQLRVPAFSAEAFEISRNSKGGSALASGVDALGSFLTLGRVSTRALGFEDTFWKVVAQRGHLWGQAMSAAEAKGLKGDSAAQFMADWMAAPPAEAIKQADDLARRVTLQTPLEGSVGKHVQGLARNGFMRWFIPFIKTPFNAFTFAFEHTPLAGFTKQYQEAIASGDKARIDVARARVGLGSVAGLAIASSAASGQITGGGPKDSGLRAGLYRKGWRPYSIKVGGKYYSYAGAEPYSTIVGLVADAVVLVQTGNANQDEYDEILAAVTFALGKNLSNKSFMQGFATFFNAVTQGDRYAENVARNFATSLPPLIGSGLTRQAARATSEFRKDPIEYEKMPRELRELPMEVQQQYSEVLGRYDEWAWINTRLGELAANVPGWSDSVPAMRDFWGRKVPNGGAWGPDIMSPIYMSVNQDEEIEINGRMYETGVIDDEMIRLKISQKGHPDNYAGFPFNAKERDFFQEQAGKYSLMQMTKTYSGRRYQKMRKIGVNQRPGSQVNLDLKSSMESAYGTARKLALRDLRKHKDLGKNFRQSEKQYSKLTLREVPKASRRPSQGE